MKIILACENKKIIKYLNEIKNNNLIIKKVQYREAIIDILKKENNINFIFLYEKIPGEISIEDLIKKIKLINKKIKIIIFLEKENIDKKIKLKNLEINNIYLINKINKKIFINILNNNSNKKILKNNQNKIKRINYKFNNNNGIKFNNKNKIEKLKKIYIKKYFGLIERIYSKIINIYLSIKNKYNKNNKIKKYKNKYKNKYKYKNKLIGVYGEKNSGKTTIIYLIIIFLLEKNNKILLINLNNKNNCFKFNNKNINKKNNYKNIEKNYNKIKNIEIKNIKNFKIINYIEKKLKKNNEDKNIIYIKNLIKENEKIYDYILIDIGYIYSKKLKEDIIDLLDKKVYICNKNILGIKEVLKNLKFNKNKRKNNKNSLHIIQNMYNLNSISNLIIQNILEKFCYVHKIFCDKKFLNLEEKFLKNQKIKLKIPIRKIIKKILS